MRSCLAIVALLVTVIAAGCVATPPIVMESGFQRKVITPCDNDAFCFRHTYDVTWDAGCRKGDVEFGALCGALSQVYPVSYRSNEYIVETGSYGYQITLPAGGTVRMIGDTQNSNK